MYSDPRVTSAFQEIERDSHDSPLHRRVIRLTARVPKRKVREHETRNTALFDNVLCGTDHHRRNAIALEVSSNQTHGLVAYWSERHE